ncbi:MAG: TatD family nuclease-associated radical SAM protein [Candidatus Ornithomonoglobus sp.]
MTILYEVHNGLYVNMTNRCPCACSFCLRQDKGSSSLYGNLWLEREPSVDEVISEFKKRDLSKYDEIVFCGFGEPSERLYDIFKVCDFLRTITKLPIRINTNGMANLIWGKNAAPDFEGRIDVVSISLNTPNKERYYEITKCKFGIDSFDAMLEFAGEVKKYVKQVVLSTVATTITEEEERQCADICGRLGVTYRIRPFESFEGDKK